MRFCIQFSRYDGTSNQDQPKLVILAFNNAKNKIHMIWHLKLQTKKIAKRIFWVPIRNWKCLCLVANSCSLSVHSVTQSLVNCYVTWRHYPVVTNLLTINKSFLNHFYSKLKNFQPDYYSRKFHHIKWDTKRVKIKIGNYCQKIYESIRLEAIHDNL